MQDFVGIIEQRLKALDWTPYRLAKEVRDRVSEQTVYNFLAGKPCKSETLAAVFDAVGLVVTVKEARK
jgi:hypothetical protein